MTHTRLCFNGSGLHILDDLSSDISTINYLNGPEIISDDFINFIFPTHKPTIQPKQDAE